MIEMKNHREKSMCCGAGGGHYWMDLKKGERINNFRVRQAQEAGADTIVTLCGAGKCRFGFYGAVQQTALAGGPAAASRRPETPPAGRTARPCLRMGWTPVSQPRRPVCRQQQTFDIDCGDNVVDASSS